MPRQRLPIEEVEIFHLLFLRALEKGLDRASYVVKGGVNLRAWLGSARYSEDLDIDVLRGEPHLVREGVDKTLSSKSFDLLVRSQQLVVSRVSKPKQTDTTQRWKFELRGPSSIMPHHTKVEFSHRGSAEPFLLEPARSEVVRAYGISAPTANHYTAPAAIRQKIRALAKRKLTQARDIWDLDHLLRLPDSDPRPLPEGLGELIEDAIDRTIETEYDVFKAQVVPFLTPEHQELFGTPEAWERIRELVADRLDELRR